jgi:ERCC4-related helicase
MRDFYEHNISMSKSVPAILGLSASPIMNLKPAALEKIETTLSAVCRTPSAHRDELLRHVNVPELCQTLFIESPPIDELVEYTRSLASLHAVYRRLDIKSDPYVLQLQEQNTERSQRQLHKVFTKHKTWCQDQMKSFCNTSAVICQELGPWASNYYISHVVTRFLQLVDSDLSHLGEGSAEETRYLARALGQVELIKMASELPAGLPMVSHKVSEFIKLLPRDSSFKTIVFVKQRATVAVLARLLSVHPQTRTQLRVGTMVGVSQSNQRAVNVADIIGLQEQKDTLEKFRHGNLDLVIATSVLEEGIDIPACNFVVCFDPPANLKSFVQRRGRARMQVSKLVLMQATSSNTLGKWQEAEAEMKRIYADDMRRLQELEEIEKEEEVDGREFRIESTG